MSDTHEPLPVAGYTAQTTSNIDLVNEGKLLEEQVLRYIDRLGAAGFYSQWLRVGRFDIQKGFMSVFRGVFQPQRVALVGDIPAGLAGGPQGGTNAVRD